MKITTIMTLLCTMIGVALWSTIIHIPDDYPIIQLGIDNSADGDTVLVQPGIYEELIEFEGHNIVLASLFLTTGDTSYISQTIIDGDNDGSTVKFVNGEDSTAVLCGFSIINGIGTYEPAVWLGGGVLIDGASPVISNNIIRNNYASMGCGIFCRNSVAKIISNTIDNNGSAANFAEFWGGGITCRDSDVEIIDNVITNNHARVGGGIFMNNSDFYLSGNVINYNHAHMGGGGGIDIHSAENSIIRNTTFRGNTAYFNSGSVGGAIYITTSDVILANLLITENTAHWGGGIYSEDESRVECENLTVVQNTAEADGGGLYCGNINFNLALFNLTNCIIWDNSPQEIFVQYSNVEIANSLVLGGSEEIPVNAGYLLWGEGCLAGDPFFNDADAGDFALSIHSPCKDAGIEDVTGLSVMPLDLAGNARIIDGDEDGNERIDMGAYEFDPASVDTDEDIVTLNPLVLEQNYPNPFNPTTVISFQVSGDSYGEVELTVYNILGQKIKTFDCHSELVEVLDNQRKYSITWNGVDERGTAVPSGIYFYKLRSGEFEQTRKMLLLK